MTTSEVREVFAVLRPALTELVAEAPTVDASFLHGDFPIDEQRAFAERVVGSLGLKEGAWRLDRPRIRSARRSRTGTSD